MGSNFIDASKAGIKELRTQKIMGINTQNNLLDSTLSYVKLTKFEFFLMKYIFVSGGVVSGLGKGVTSASLAFLLKSRGFRITKVKIDM